MANPQTNLRVRFSADLADIKQGLSALRGELARVKTEAARSQPDMAGWSKGIGKIRSDLNSLVGAYVGLQTIGAGISSLFGALDRADRIGELAVQSSMSTEALSRLAFGAQFSEVNIESLNTSVVKFSRGLLENEKILKSVGVATRESTGAWRDTDQILLDVADVFASLPDGPERAALAVKLFGRAGADLIPLLVEGRAKLEEYGRQADATGNTISGAASKAAGEFNDNLDRLKGTLAGVANETVKALIPAIAGYAGQAVAAGQASSFAADTGGFLATSLKVVAAGAIIVKNVVEILTNQLAFFGTTAVRVAEIVSGNLGRAFGNVAAAYKALSDGQDPLKVLGTYWQQQKKVLGDTRDDLAAFPREVNTSFKSMKSGVLDAAADIKRVGDLFDSTAAKARQGSADVAGSTGEVKSLSQAALEALRKLLDADGAGKNGADKVKQLAASTELLQDSLKRAQEKLQRMYEDSEVSTAAFFEARQALQEQAIDAQLEQARAELAITKDLGQRRSLEQQIVTLQRERAEVGATAAREQAKAEEELAKQLGDVKIRLLELDGQTGTAERARLEAEYQDLFKRLEANSDASGKAIVRNLIDRLSAKAQLDAFEAEMQRVLGSLQATETSLSAQQQAGLAGVLESERQVQAQRVLSLEQLVALRQRAQEFLATLSTGSPESLRVLDFLNQLNGNIANVTTSMQRFRQQTADAAIDSLTTLFVDLTSGTKSAGEALRDFVRGFVASMAQIAARALATFIVLQLLDRIYPGLGKATAATMSAGVKHSGGIAGEGGTIRSGLSPLLFAAAPRYHGGGIAGLAPDEVPAVLRKGEEVLPENDPRHRNNGGAGDRMLVKTPIVAIGDRAVADAMSGAAGQEVILTVVRNEWEGLVRGG